MAEPGRSNNHDDTPIYTIKTVVQQTGISSATLRAWERRYGVLSPGRSDGGYRLYSERDIAILRWLRSQIDAGVSISSAVALLELQHQAGEAPEQEMAPPLGREVTHAPRSADIIVRELSGALLAFGEAEGETILAEAFALYPIEDVTEQIIAPVLVEIGDRWHRGEVTIVQEHFATAFLRQRLLTLFQVYDQSAAGPLAITGSAPGEWHDVGILLVSLALRRHGWRVIYLGQNVPAAHLIESVKRLRPNLVCLSAATLESVPGLEEIYTAFGSLTDPKPQLVFGGHILNLRKEVRERFPGAYLAMSAHGLVAAVSAT